MVCNGGLSLHENPRHSRTIKGGFRGATFCNYKWSVWVVSGLVFEHQIDSRLKAGAGSQKVAEINVNDRINFK